MKQTEIIAYLNGHCSTEQARALERWIQADKAHEEQFLQIKKIWEAREKADQIPASDVDQAWVEVQKRIRVQPKRSVPLWGYRIAASIALLFSFGLGWYFFNTAPDWQTFAVNDREIPSMVELPDGSKVWLNEYSRILYPEKFGKRQRTVELIGQAYFKVAESEDQPFVIKAGEAEVEVLGTTFDVMAYRDSSHIEVTVNSGKVGFSHQKVRGSQLILEKGQGGRFSKTDNRLVKLSNIDANKLAWYTRELVFKDTPLPEVIRTLESTFDIVVSLDLGSKEAAALNATLPIENINETLAVIGSLYDLKISRESEKSYLFKYSE